MHKVYFRDANFVLADVIGNFISTEDYRSADAVVSGNDIVDFDRNIILTSNYLGRATLVMQHGLRASREYVSPHHAPLIAEKIMVWGPKDKERLIQSGVEEERIIVTGTTLFDHLIPKEPHDGINIVFAPMHWSYNLKENKILASRLREIKGINLITKLIEGMDSTPYDNPVYSNRNSYDHLDICASILSKADLVVGINESTFEFFAHYLGIPVLLVDLWEAKYYEDRLFFPEISSWFSNACQKTDIDHLERVVFETLANPGRLSSERKKALYEEAGVGWSSDSPKQLITKAINETIQQRNIYTQTENPTTILENASQRLTTELNLKTKNLLQELAIKESVIEKTRRENQQFSGLIAEYRDQNKLPFNPLDYPIMFSPPNRLVEPNSWVEHIPFAMFLMDLIRPGLLVELGTHSGNSYSAFCQANKELYINTKCFAVDTWQGDPQAGFYDQDTLADLRAHHDPLYGGFSNLLQMTFDEAVNTFSDGSIDLLHIDGCHSYEMVKHDFETWLPKVSQRGVIVFHDTHVHERDFGVWKLWNELKAIHPSFEFFHGNGLGILAVGQQYPPSLDILFKSTTEGPAIRELFCLLGSRLNKELTIRAQSATIQSLSAQLQDRQNKLAEITSSKMWKIGSLLRKMGLAIAPPNTIRARVFNSVYKLIVYPFIKIRDRQTASKNLTLIKSSDLFDPAWYLAGNPDVARTGMDPAKHYLLSGAFEERDPSPAFSSGYYLKTYPDVREARVNPLVHYLENGRKEGRKALPNSMEHTKGQALIANPYNTPQKLVRKEDVQPRPGEKPRKNGFTSADKFVFHLESDLSVPFRVGEGNVLLLEGWCFHPEIKIKRLYVLANQRQFPVFTRSYPRLDVLRDLARYDIAGNSLMSGFSIGMPVEKINEPGKLELTLRAVFQNGVKIDRPMGVVNLLPDPAQEEIDLQPALPNDQPLVAICMATYDPPLDLFEKQIHSILQQQHQNWICIIQDDCSSPKFYEQIQEITSIDARFHVFQNESNLGLYYNFEKSLTRVPKTVDFIAFCDQDDEWNPDKISKSLKAFTDENVKLVYSDMNIVDQNGKILSNTYWTFRRNNYTSLEALLFANTVTGAASIFRAELLKDVLPFPKRIADAYHDHWVACVALSKGSINYIDEALYSYTQHSNNAYGYHKISPIRLFPEAARIIQWIRSPSLFRTEMEPVLKQLDSVYFHYLMRLVLISKVLLLRVPEAQKTKVSILKQIASFEKSMTGLIVQGIKYKLYARPTLGYEWMAIRAYLGHHVMGYYYSLNRVKLYRSQFSGPSIPALSHVGQGSAANVNPNVNADSIVERVWKMIAPLKLNINEHFEARVNLVMATINFKYVFGGYIGMFNFAKKLAQQGHRVRIIIVEPCDYDPPRWKREMSAYPGLEDLFDIVETSYHNDRSVVLEVNPKDVFIATSCWTAQIVHRTMQLLGREKFIYFAQEYEPIFFPTSSFYALSHQSYFFPQYTIFSTNLLREYFKQNRFGVYSNGEAFGDENSIFFNNAINQFNVSADSLARRKRKKLLFYARPEAHAARNMFELGILGLSHAVQAGCFPLDKWEFEGIGSVGLTKQINLGRGVVMKLLPKVGLSEYLKLLPTYDLGISLMLSPHPSLLPIEMAAAGMISITNTFANKTGERLSAISPNIIAVPPTIEGIVDGIGGALQRIDYFEERTKGAHVNWCTNWDDSFNQDFMNRLNEFIKNLSE